MPRDRERSKSITRRRSKSRNPRPSEQLRAAIQTVQDTVAHVERNLDKEIVSRVLTDEVITDAEFYAKRIAKAVGNTMRSASDHNICNSEFSVITEGPDPSTHASYNAPLSTVRVSSTIKAQRQMKEKSAERRDELKRSFQKSQHAQVRSRSKQEMISSRQAISRKPRASSNELKDQERKYKNELRAVKKSYAKLKSDTEIVNEKHNKALKSILKEMVRAEKKFKKDKAEFERINRLLLEKNRLKHERIKNLMKLIKVKDSELKEKSDQIRNLHAELETTKEKLKVPEKKEISLHTKKISTQDTIIRALIEESSCLKQKVLQLSL